jgi:hypothetical protein
MMRITIIAALLLTAGLSAVGARALAGSYEAPAYRVLEQRDGFEIRDYAPTIEARVTVRDASFEEAVTRGFRPLANYIFGGNTPRESIDMTTPVSASRAEGQKIAMTVPVSATDSGGAWTVSFTMPSRWNLETLPTPDSGEVTLVEVPGGRFAAAQFSGRMDDQLRAEREAELLEALAVAGLEPAGEAVIAQYNPPWIPGFLRRNEVLIPLAEAPTAAR